MVENEYETVRDLAASPAVVGVARDVVARQARLWGLEQVRDDLLKITAELVGNAVGVAGWGETIRLSVRRDAGGVVVGVWDSSNERPESRAVELTLDVIDALPDDHEFGGWGLSIVEQLCDYTGVRWTPPQGKWVWGRISP